MKAQLFIRKQTLYVRLDGELDSSVTDGLRIKMTDYLAILSI